MKFQSSPQRLNLATFFGGGYKPFSVMAERENVELIDDQRDIVGPLNMCGPKSSGNVGVTVLHIETINRLLGAHARQQRYLKTS